MNRQINQFVDENRTRAIAFDGNTLLNYGNGILRAFNLNSNQELFNKNIPLYDNPTEQLILKSEEKILDNKIKPKIPFEAFRKNAYLLTEQNKVYLGVGNLIYIYSNSGDLLNTVPLQQPSVGMVLGNQTIWVATQDKVFAIDLEGNVGQTLLDGKRLFISHISYDKSLDQIWLSRNNGVYRYDLQNKQQSHHPIFYAQQLISNHNGSVFVVSWNTLIKLTVNADQSVTKTKKRWSGKVVGMVTSDDSLWLAGTHRLVQFDNQLEQLQIQRFDHREGSIRALALQSQKQAPFAPPALNLINPQPNTVLNTALSTIDFSVEPGSFDVDLNSLIIQANGKTLGKKCQFETVIHCQLDQNLTEGEFTLTAIINDIKGNASNQVIVDFSIAIPEPIITITSPQNEQTQNKIMTLSGHLNVQAKLSVVHQAANYVNTFDLNLIDNNAFITTVDLKPGANTFTLNATTDAGKKDQKIINITLASQPPTPIQSKIKAQITSGTTQVTGEAGSVESQTIVRIKNNRTSTMIETTASQDGSFEITIVANDKDELSITALNQAGNESQPIIIIVKGPVIPDLPPDPIDIAPPVDAGVSTSVDDATIFIHQGDNPIQTGVKPGTIESKRAVLLRGKVTDINGAAIYGVTVTIPKHDEFGQTKTRADGAYDMVVNGGGYVTVQYRKTGYPPIQRKVMAPWQDYVVLPDVVMIPFDEKVTKIDLTDNTKTNVAQSSVVSDKDGKRQGTVLFQPGTTATITLKDGTTKQLNQMNVRITEFTVGDNGPKAMPAELPPGTDYTYAIELTVEEALNEGVKINGKDVVFNKPVPYYVENFLGFPTGTIVPVGYYDSDRAAWIAADNGKVIEILSIVDGKANVDIDGDKIAEGSDALTTFGITENEQVKLATLYTAGQTIWRVPLAHFSTYDLNYGRDCGGPCEDPNRDNVKKENKKLDPNIECGSIIQCESQILGETIPVTNVPWSLYYNSDRVPGRKTSHTINIPVSGNTVPSNVSSIKLEIIIAGQLKLQKEFDPLPNQQYKYVWDGKDAFDRTLSGSQKATVKVGYLYNEGNYYLPPNVSKSFGYPTGQLKLSDVKARSPTIRWQEYKIDVSIINNSKHSLGGWNVGIHHALDVSGQILS